MNHSSRWGGGVMNIIPRIGQVVPGVIYQASPATWTALDAKESAPKLYRPVNKVALDLDGQLFDVGTYQLYQEQLTNFQAPSERYVAAISEGLDAMSLPDVLLQAAIEGKQTPFLFDCFFFYGTLMQGECREKIVRQIRGNYLQAATTAGQLIDLEDYPGMISTTNVESPFSRTSQSCPDQAFATVLGEVVRFPNLPQALATIDPVEDFSNYTSPDGHITTAEVDACLYRRVLKQINYNVDNNDLRFASPNDHKDDLPRYAWTYLYNLDFPTPKLIQSGNWRERFGNKPSHPSQ